MRLKILTLLTFTMLCSLPLLANAATYNYYFSNAGSGNTCSEGSPCANLSDAQAKIDAAGSSDIVNLYFNRGDTWSKNTAAENTTICHGLLIGSDDPIVNINAYGSGNDPCFDGLVSDFSTTPEHNATTGPLSWQRFFEFNRNSCSIKNVEIKRVYGNGVGFGSIDSFDMDYCNIHDFGSSGIWSKGYAFSNITVQHSTFHTGQELYRYGKRGGWGAAISLTTMNNLPQNNIIKYNLVYDIYGEGINGPNALVEYNVVGDTASIGINTSPHKWDSLTTTVRYNFLIFSDPSSSVYDDKLGVSTGIRVFDEDDGGTNANAVISIYGNIVIGRNYGIRVYTDDVDHDAFGTVRIYNNIIIDSYTDNIRFSDSASPNNGENLADALYFYNNASILYDRVGSGHATDNFLPNAGFIIDNNAFWTTGGSPNVDSDWRTNYVTGDPKLYGEEKGSPVDWDGQTGPTYYSNIEFSDICPDTDSALIGAGKTLGSGYENMFLTTGTDFSALPYTTTIQRTSQSVESNLMTIGAIVPGGGTPINPPMNLTISPK